MHTFATITHFLCIRVSRARVKKGRVYQSTTNLEKELISPATNKICILEGELKAEISTFSNIFFGKPNISKIKFVGLFPLVSFFFARKLRSKLGFFRCGLKN